MSKKSLIILLIGWIQVINAQWVSTFYGNIGPLNTSLANAHGTAINIDDNGYCYVTGFVNENNGAGNDILIIKYDAQSGDTIWTGSFNGSANNDDQGYAVTTDSHGNVYVIGTAWNANTNYDIELLKYNSQGSLLWHRSISGENINAEDRGLDLAIDNSGNVYLTGFCTNADIYTDIITQKYAPDGTLEWSVKEDGCDNLDARGSGIAICGSGIYVVGYVTSSENGKDIVLLKYDTSGNQQFMRQYNGGGNAEDRAFGIVAEDDHVYIGGYVTTASSIDCITLKYDNNGDLDWARTYNGQAGEEDKAFGIIVDKADGSVYITGRTRVVSGNNDYLTVCYDATGYQQWASTYNGTGNGSDEAVAIGLINNSNNSRSVIVTGYSWGTNNDYDYATVRYNISSGSQQNVSRYSFNQQSNDFSQDIATDSQNNSYVTGYSQLLGGNGPTGISAVSTLMYPQYEGSELITQNNQPQTFSLSQNYPNPFNPSTAIKFSLPGGSNVKLIVYDITGRTASKLIDQYMAAGSYNITFTTGNLSSGVYFYELTAGAFRDVKKMTLIK